MENRSFLEKWIRKFKNFWSGFTGGPPDDEGQGLMRREKITVAVFAYIIALILWLLVNLGRTFNLSVKIPLVAEQLPVQRALTAPLPKYVTVNFNGEGWKLINIYHNPPPVHINPRKNRLNLYDIVREQMNTFPGITVLKVQPSVLMIHTDKKVHRKVPIVSNIELETKPQFDLIDSPKLTPDSVTVTGAKSIVDNIEEWETKAETIKDASKNIDRIVTLEKPISILNLSFDKVRYRAKISEFTEGEVKIPIQTKNIPQGRDVTYSPSLITIKYDVPLDEYTKAKNRIPFTAYVPYQDIVRDTTGFVTPYISKESDTLHIKLRSYQPRKVAYYNVISGGRF